MICCVSTSSPLVSAAVFNGEGLVSEASVYAPRNASGQLIKLLEQLEVDLDRVETFVADIGPGSFSGTRVGVMMAKTWAWTTGAKIGGILSFDLMAADGVASVPFKKDRWLVRTSSGDIVESDSLEGCGYTSLDPDGGTFPKAANLTQVFDRIKWATAVDLVPEYVLLPSISRPKKVSGGLKP
ncbi:MAG: hypothetical protein J0L72_03100 [Armatimonadetes bacterium]|nr:hypothetical protein [Armatimonadota bacterium]